ncbi:DNA repair protein RecO [Alicyclobacillus cycloheptanicus]|uniref:DNA repair protein RecO n=1 Tax=Alicyclobacillus cycloheptanicus TaxID=1457 RepID=A0ABT9XJK0_9BACL|nr:DNA repair protein RecO [Alicyclobacillus cycloheptanicus]MDQ0190470.1 DNA repair protein RecO (recombination protein O) [Alicyclobacillus cycloheptanicus]WDM00767.1 DNA repair protein RecO [Alicyclobacillus cycloheptanicus]
MIYNTEAVVIRSIAYGETHAIVTLLTPNGTVAAMARGAKKPQSRLAAGVQLFVKGMYTLYQNRGMGSLNQVEILDARRPLRENLDLAAYAAYFCELVHAVAEERPHGSHAVYTQFEGALQRLLAEPAMAGVFARVWEAKVLRMSGASPDWTRCVRCTQPLEGTVGYSSTEGGFLCQRCQAADEAVGVRSRLIPASPALPRALESFSRVPWERLGQIRLSEASRRTLNEILRAQLLDFAGLSLKSRTILESITNE